MAGTVAPRRKRNLLMTVAVALATTGGVAVWLIWPASTPAISVPDRVCAEKLPGKPAASLLPKSGGNYREYSNRLEGFGLPYTGPPPVCTFVAGDRRVTVDYDKFLDTDSFKTRHEAEEQVERVASNPGSAPLRLGEARGYTSKRAAVLLLNCPMQGYPGAITARVYDMDEFPSDSSDAKAFAELTAETLRLAAQKVYKCGTSQHLPSGSPSLGRPRSE